MARVSFSQYSMWSSCPQQYKLAYIDDLSVDSANINLIFGTSMHTVIQKFLDVMYNATKSSAMSMDLDRMLKDALIENFNKEKEKLAEGVHPCTKEELEEFFGDGRKILRYFKGKLPKYFSKKGWKLEAIEMPLNAEIKPGVHFVGFIDIVLKDTSDNTILIIDLKTSTRGWGKYQKTDPVKNSQILLYKKFYAEKYSVSEDKISVEFHILKRKIDENAEFPAPRISRHVPAHGKPSVNKAWGGFMEFVNNVFDETGNYKTDIVYEARKGKQCDWCEFKERGLCSVWKKFI
jgi:hypothetical protein